MPRAGYGLLTSHWSLSLTRLCLLMLCPQLLVLLPLTHSEVPTPWYLCFSYQSNAESKQNSAPAYCLVCDVLRSPGLFEVIGQLSFWPPFPPSLLSSAEHLGRRMGRGQLMAHVSDANTRAPRRTRRLPDTLQIKSQAGGKE